MSSLSCSLSKRDAVAFVRAVRRHGLQSRLADIAAEVGGAVESAEPQAQQLLWSELAEGCKRALELAAEQDKQQGQLHDPRVSSAWELLAWCLHVDLSTCSSGAHVLRVVQTSFPQCCVRFCQVRHMDCFELQWVYV